jgi:NADH dehydrogenase (ubiquinone) Fe-S protein 3
MGNLSEYARYVSRLVPKFITRYSIYKDELTFQTEKEHLLPLMQFLKQHQNALFTQLSDLTAVDWPGRENRFELVYNLLSYRHASRIRVKLSTDELTSIPTLSYLFSGANWYEREIYDLFGVIFEGHPDLRRILTDYGFEGHPMRKDYPLTGYTELRYDEEKKRIVQQPLKLTQEFRNFDFLSPWQQLPDKQEQSVLESGKEKED